MTPVLDARGVSWGPKRSPAILQDISFALHEGEVLAICGANGAGKCSLLRLLFRQQAPDRGLVLLRGQNPWSLPAREAARVAAAVLQEQPTDFALSGAVFLVLADTLARVAPAPEDLPIGVVTGLVGGMFFLWLMARR